MTKISKTQLKRNELVDGLKLVVYYFRNNLKVVVITITSIIFIIIAGSSVLFIKRKNNQLSAETLSQAINVYHLGDRKNIIDSMSILKSIIEKYPHTLSTAIAYYYLGNLNYQLADYQQSLLYYKDFINKYPNHILVRFVQRNIACVYESQKNFDEAAKIYENLTGTVREPSLLLDLARIYELQGQLEKAKDIYSHLPDNEEAKFRLSCL